MPLSGIYSESTEIHHVNKAQLEVNERQQNLRVPSNTDLMYSGFIILVHVLSF